MLKNTELGAHSDIKEIKTHLLNVLTLHFHSTIIEFIVLAQLDLIISSIN